MKTNAFSWKRDGSGVVTLTFDCPGSSVNVFTRDVMQELDATLDSIIREHAHNPIGAFLFESAKEGNFIAGADLNEILRVNDPEEAASLSRMGQEIFQKLADAPFPTAALIHGTALGGGLEIALACDMRFASDDSRTRLGFPETKLGVIPAWGGCTRLPRIVGVEYAVEMILEAHQLSAQEAYSAGLVTAVAAQEDMRALALKNLALMYDVTMYDVAIPTGHLDAIELSEEQEVKMSEMLKLLEDTQSDYPALPTAIHAVQSGLANPQAGFSAEQRLFGDLAVGLVCKSLVRLFLHQEAARKNPGAQADPRMILRSGIVGAGVMGQGIAYLFAARARVPTRVSDAQEEALGSMLVSTRNSFAYLEGRGLLTPIQAEERHSLISPTVTLDGLEHADFIVEAVSENLELKQKIFRELSERVSKDCILASNTSTLPIKQIADAVSRPERVIGMHFFNPPEKMPLIEIVVAEQTSPETVATTFALAKRFGKTPIYVRDCPGFLVNRLLMPYEIAALELFLAGIPMEVLDKVMEDWGMKMGPIATLDHVGLDIARDVASTLSEAYPDRMAQLAAFSKLVDAGYLGDKNGKGFWMRFDKKRVPNPEVHELLGIGSRIRRYNDSEIVEHLLRPMAEEARRCLDEGIVLSRGDIDLSLVLGIGFPPFRGSVLDLLS